MWVLKMDEDDADIEVIASSIPPSLPLANPFGPAHIPAHLFYFYLEFLFIVMVLNCFSLDILISTSNVFKL